MSQPLHRLMMIGGLKLRHLFAFPRSVRIGVKVNDGLGGSLQPDGRFYKQFDTDVHQKLSKGKREALKILEKAGAENIMDFGLSVAGRVGGLIRIGEHVDANLETEFQTLHVCDGSVVPDDMKGPPTVTLVCLANYLSKHLLSRLGAPDSAGATHGFRCTLEEENRMNTADPKYFHQLYGKEQKRITYFKKDFVDYMIMSVVCMVGVYFSYGAGHPLAIIGIVGIVSETKKRLLVQEDDNGKYVLEAGRWLHPYIPKPQMVHWQQRYSPHKPKCVMHDGEGAGE